MPEGDTLWNIAHRLRPALAGEAARRIEVHRPRYRPPEPGTRIESVESVGKHLLITFEGGVVVHSHLQMSGEWHLYRLGQRWRDSPGAVRIRVTTDDAEAICFRAPTVDVYPARDPRPRPWRLIGPDLCSSDVDLDRVIANIARDRPDREIAEVLLDQRHAAGIGNVYKSEVLWACRVDPFARLDTLNPDQCRLLYDTAHRQLRANLGRSRRQTFQRGLAVYGRARRDCPRCHATVLARKQGELARVTYWCPRCQSS